MNRLGAEAKRAHWLKPVPFLAGVLVPLWSFAISCGAKSAAEPAPVKPLSQGAISYYNGACTHCHGPYGSAYGASFFKKYDLKQLESKIADMANGPGQSPLDDEGLHAQVAFHQAMIAKAPFIDWTGQSGNKLTGEVTAKAAVTATVGESHPQVLVSGTSWTVVLPDGAAPRDLRLSATLKGVITNWQPTKAPFSVPPKWPPVPVE